MMNAGALIKKYRRRKQNNKEDISGRGRSLSDLPDDVLLHILSFLPMKDAVRTSILSKRWEYIWTSIPKLHFDQGDGEPKNFVNFVRRALRLHESYGITHFSLQCDMDPSNHVGDSDPLTFIDKWYSMGEVDEQICMSHVEEWISAVVRFNVRHVELKLDCFAEPLTLPPNFVNCGTLTDFTLEMAGSDLNEFTSSVCFSNLKKLEITSVTFSDEHSIQQLFSGCPVLEDLKLECCDWEYVKTVSVASPRLRYFTMIEHDEESQDGDEFVIIGGGLKSFHYEGQFHFNYNILNSELLENACINYNSPENPPIHVFYRFSTLLKCISNVRNLTLWNALLLLDMPELVIHIPVLTGVRHLELGYKSSDLSNVGLLKILQSIPCLESLVFSRGIKVPSNPVEDRILDPVPPCFLYHLDFIFIQIKCGDAEEMEGVKVLLKNALVLEEMAIEFWRSVKEDIKNKFCLELLKLPRGSKHCGIYIRE